VKTQFTQTIKKLLWEGETAQPVLIAAVRLLEKFYAKEVKDVERAELAKGRCGTGHFGRGKVLFQLNSISKSF